MMKILKRGRLLAFCALLCLLFATVASAAGSGDVASAVESTWTTASTQIKTVVDNVVFPVIDMVLAIAFFVKLGTAYFDYRKSGQFEWTAPAILFACLVFTLTAPTYIWGMLPIFRSEKMKSSTDGREKLFPTFSPMRSTLGILFGRKPTRGTLSHISSARTRAKKNNTM